MPAWLPYVVGVALVVQFAGLGAWQISRGLEKRAQRDFPADESHFATWSGDMEIRPYQRLQATGTFDAEHQFLLANIIIDSRLGYYVLTPFDVADNEPLLIINRGWIEKTASGVDDAMVLLDVGRITVRGYASSLPQGGKRQNNLVAPGQAWPRRAVYPTLDDLAAALGRELQPFVLLLDPQDERGFFRHWVAEEMGPGRHFAYALQWLAMSAVFSALLIRNFRRRKASTD